MDYFKRGYNKTVGPGGWKCFCCGPKPKNRPFYRRMNRRKLKNAFRRQLRKEED